MTAILSKIGVALNATKDMIIREPVRTTQLASKAFSEISNTKFNAMKNIATKVLSNESLVKAFIDKVSNAQLYTKGSNFNELSPVEKKNIAKAIIVLNKEGKTLQTSLQKSPLKFAKDLIFINLTTKILKNMYQSVKVFAGNDIEKQYENNAKFNSKLLDGLSLTHRMHIYDENLKNESPSLELFGSYSPKGLSIMKDKLLVNEPNVFQKIKISKN